MTRVLYVEDESLLAISTEDLLNSEGFTVELAFDSDEGLTKARSFVPDIILTDFMMSRMDEFIMVRKLRELGITAPVIVTTAMPEADLEPAFRGQIDAYVSKPFTDRALISALRRAHADRSPQV